VIIDHDGYDRWRDELVVPDPFEIDFEPVHTHGLVVPTDAEPVGTPASTPHILPGAGRGETAGADPHCGSARGTQNLSDPAGPGGVA
jgi:hypothetical protein